MTEISAWVVLRRYDLVDLSKEEAPLSNPLSIHLKKDLTFQELQVEVRKWLGLQPDSTEVIKLRLKDRTLVPLSSLLAGNSENEPLLMEVAKVHQHALSSGTPLPKIYKEAIENKIQDLQKRLRHCATIICRLRPDCQQCILLPVCKASEGGHLAKSSGFVVHQKLEMLHDHNAPCHRALFTYSADGGNDAGPEVPQRGEHQACSRGAGLQSAVLGPPHR